MMKIFEKFATILLLVCLSWFPHHLCAQINLDDLASDYVLEKFVVRIPGYPQAFNPSIVKWDGKYLMSFRFISNPHNVWHSKIGLVWLDENFQVIGYPEVLDTRFSNPHIPHRSEDARLVVSGDHLYITYNDCVEGWDEGTRRMWLAELKHTGENFYISSLDCLDHYPGEHRRWEKNWMPFDYNGILLFVYCISPNRVYLPYIGLGSCDLISETHGDLQWAWGELRGGTPPVLVDGEYLSFFHSMTVMSSVQSNNGHTFHYYIGAYTFSATPPFGITRMSSNPVVGKGMYMPPLNDKKVIYPGGFVEEGEYLWLSCGRDDCEICMVKIDKKGLLASLRTVNSHE